MSHVSPKNELLSYLRFVEIFCPTALCGKHKYLQRQAVLIYANLSVLAVAPADCSASPRAARETAHHFHNSCYPFWRIRWGFFAETNECGVCFLGLALLGSLLTEF